ncbi:MAG TPA: hypothetical protein VFX16_06385 [Pseudonocardiaceae bacterium]|nr:hypothetical protein [Pseudonocardiaceae bacterium]
MPMEIERKFLVADGWSPAADVVGTPIRQGYLTDGGAGTRFGSARTGTAG